MRAVPMACGGGHAGESLESTAALVRALKVVAGGTIDEQHEWLRALRDVVQNAFVGGDAKIEKRVGEPDLILERGEVAALVAGDGGGDGIESVETEIGAVREVVQEAGVENVLGRDVVLQAEKIVAGPVLPGVGAGGLLLYDGENVLDADGIGKPETAAKDGTGKRETRIPIAEVKAFLNVDAGNGIGGAETPLVVAIRSFEAEDIRAGVGIGGTEAAGLDFGGARGVDVEA